MNHADLASRILSEHYGAASTLPERDEATGTGPATADRPADRPADVWRESAGTIEQRDGKPEPKLATTAEERWAKQMARCEAMIEKQERMQEREEKEHSRINELLDMAQKVLVSFIAKTGGPATAAEIERTHELAKRQGWTETAVGMISPKPEPKITKTYTDAKAYEYSQGGYTKEQEIRELRFLVEDQKAIIADLEKQIEAGRKRGQMVRDLLSKEV